jgi:hypothetical protein
LRPYGFPDSAYSGDIDMFKLMHEMRVRIMTAPAFTGAKVIAAILSEGTMDWHALDRPVPTFLWEERGRAAEAPSQRGDSVMGSCRVPSRLLESGTLCDPPKSPETGLMPLSRRLYQRHRRIRT